MDAQIHSYLHGIARKRPEHEEVGPFVAGYDAASDNPARNYAVPEGGAAPSEDDVAALVAAFERRGRTPRLEYVEGAAPEVESALVAAGFRVDSRSTVLTRERGDLQQPAADGIELVDATSDEDLLAAAGAQHAGYGEAEPAGDADVARLRLTLDLGGGVLLAREGGDVVGAGLHMPIVDGVTEVGAVATTHDSRGDEVVAALVAGLAARAFDAGASTVWYESIDDGEQALLERLGFGAGSTKLALTR